MAKYYGNQLTTFVRISLSGTNFPCFFNSSFSLFIWVLPTSRYFLQISGFGRLKKTDFTRANKHAALLNFAVKTP